MPNHIQFGRKLFCMSTLHLDIRRHNDTNVRSYATPIFPPPASPPTPPKQLYSLFPKTSTSLELCSRTRINPPRFKVHANYQTKHEKVRTWMEAEKIKSLVFGNINYYSLVVFIWLEKNRKENMLYYNIRAMKR